MFQKISCILFFITTFTVTAQQNGYWDKDRATTKEIIVSAQDRITVKTEDLPVGTTEVVYRITLLDENQQIASSLVSVLKAIPDPTGISQGSAGAVFLLSKVSGDDKCKYAVFSDGGLASAYEKTGKTEKACITQEEPLNKDARRLTINKLKCLQSDLENLWFGFESKNWVMKQKIVLEVVPWVDNKLSRGWNLENRKSIINQIKSSELAKKMIHSNDFVLCILGKVQKDFTYNELQELLAIERKKVYKDYGNTCLTEKPVNTGILTSIRIDAMQYFKNKRYAEAIDLLNSGVIDNGNANVADYNAIATYYLYSRQYDKAERAIIHGLQLDSTELGLQLNLAHYYLLTNQLSKAKSIHKKYKLQNVTAITGWSNKTKMDFEDFKKAGIESKDFEKILKIFE
jgi:tetratricopeptide (TPR) repeat protein